MNSRKVEKILLCKLIQKLEFGDPISLKIKEEEILGIYIVGSRLWDSSTIESDLDYCIIVSDDCELFKFNQGYFQKESETIDLHFLSESHYKHLLQEADELAFSVYFQKEPILKYDVVFKIDEIDLSTLRKSFSTKANNSFVKAKKKLTVEYPKHQDENEIKLSYKSLFHSIRILDFGTVIALNKIQGTKIYLDDLGLPQRPIKNFYKENDNDWGKIHEHFKPIFNQFASEFKKLAPKEPKTLKGK